MREYDVVHLCNTLFPGTFFFLDAAVIFQDGGGAFTSVYLDSVLISLYMQRQETVQ